MKLMGSADHTHDIRLFVVDIIDRSRIMLGSKTWNWIF